MPLYFWDFGCMNFIPATGVLPMGGDFLAPAVSQSLPVILFVYSADPPQDAAGCLPATGNTMVAITL